MTPYAAALMSALREGLPAMESALTQPMDPDHDLRSLLEGLLPAAAPDHLPEQPTGPPTRSTASTEQALAAVRLATEAVDNLLLLGAVDQPLAARVTAALARIQARLSAQLRESRAGKLRGLYVIIDPAAAPSDPLAVAAAALRAGACAIQWRDKLRDKGDQIQDCLRLLELCARHDALFIVNDHADLAASCGAHGLHVGQHDLPLPHARQVMAPHQIVGSSNATVEEAAESHGQGADYVAVGAIFPTGTKSNTRPAGLETLRRVRSLVQGSIVAIGGINEANAADVIAAGADAVAVISAVAAANDPEAAARSLIDRIQDALAARGAA